MNIERMSQSLQIAFGLSGKSGIEVDFETMTETVMATSDRGVAACGRTLEGTYEFLAQDPDGDDTMLVTIETWKNEDTLAAMVGQLFLVWASN